MGKANKTLSKWFNWFHIGFTFGGTFIVLVLSLF